MIQLPFGRVAAWRDGSGFPLILIHGIGQGSWIWERSLPILSEHYDVYAIDLPGFFDSRDRPDEWYTIEDFARAVVALLDTLHLQRAHIAGHHGGGFIALELAASCGDRVAKLILSDTPCWSRSEGRQYHEQGWLPRQCTDRGFMPPWTADEVRRFVPGADERAVMLWSRGHSENKSWLLMSHAALGEYDAPRRLDRVRAPTLLIYGVGSSPHHLAGRRTLLSGIAGAKAVDIAESGALAPYEQPEAFCTEAIRFLA